MDWGRNDGAATAGYRDVALNLRLRTAAAIELGVDAHVCEVQLLLRQFAEIKVLRFSYFSYFEREREGERERGRERGEGREGGMERERAGRVRKGVAQ